MVPSPDAKVSNLQFRDTGGFVDDRRFTFAVEGYPGFPFAQGIWRNIMADADKSANLSEKAAPAGLEGLQAAVRDASTSGRKGPAPVHLWNPPYCGEIGMKIARDGTWFYQGSPIGRPAMVKLFASILRKDPERFVLVTPVEMVGIEVEDAPFLAVEMRADDDAGHARLIFRTNVDDEIICDATHPVRFEKGAAGGVKPYIRVRGDLWALVTRALTYDLLARGEVRDIDGVDTFGVQSSGAFFAIASAADMDAPDGGSGDANT